MSSPSRITRSSERCAQASPFCPNIAATPDGSQVWFTLKDTRQDRGVRRAAAVHGAQDARYRPDHQSRQHRAQCAWPVRLCHRRRPERGESVPHRRFRAGRDDPGRQAAAWHLAVGRWFARLCRVGERRRDDRDRYADQQSDRDACRSARRRRRWLRARCGSRRSRERKGCSLSASPVQAAHFTMLSPAPGQRKAAPAPTSVTLFDQGLSQVLEAAVTGLEPKHPYVLALASQADGSGTWSCWRAS